MTRSVLAVIFLAFSSWSWGRSLQCEPISEPLAKVAFSPIGASEEVQVLIPKDYKGANLLSLSLLYGNPPKLSVPVELWPDDSGLMAAYFRVERAHEQFELHATYVQGACSKGNTTIVKSWAGRHE